MTKPLPAGIPKLQWGLGLSTEEGRAKPSPLKTGHPASMGPRSFNRGRRGPDALCGVSHGASMGPRSFNRGRTSGGADWNGQTLASMGPRSFNRGRPDTAQRHPSPATPLQWGLGLSTEEGPSNAHLPAFSAHASMGPRSFNRGRATQCVGLGVRMDGFNGASVFQPRKALQMGTIRLIPQIASMGPRSFNRGRQSTFPATCLASAASMGPRSFNRGRRFDNFTASFSFEGASMGPRSFNRGRVAVWVA